MDLHTPLTYVKGIGPVRAAVLEAKGLVTVEDLLAYLPVRYEDRSNLKSIRKLAPGEMATVVADVRSARLTSLRRGRGMGIFEVVFTDASQGTLTAKWFNGGYLANVLVPGLRVALFGKIETDSFSGQLSIVKPEFEILSSDEEEPETGLHTGRIVPVHEAAGKITARIFRNVIRFVLDSIEPLDDPLPEEIRRTLKLPDRWTATQQVHFPEDGADARLLNAFRSQAQFRLIFEEFFWLETGLALKRNKARAQPGISFALNEKVRDSIKRMLPFKPTGAQKRVLSKIAQDMAEPHPMHRLLQGDVGSGKTLVAAEAAIIAIENGYQVALLAPTEILASQHDYSIRNLFANLGYISVLLTGSNTAREKVQLKRLIAEGLVHIVVGTHAILESDVEFKRLGLAIIDEQHRFGVMQRLKLYEKGRHPDILVMTATPIPRTLALTMYGDLDTSVIDEMPPGRKPVVTKHVMHDRAEQVYAFARQQVMEGRQVYVVCPVIEDSETQASKAAQATYQELSEDIFSGLRMGLLHGKLPAAEKEEVMRRFKSGDTQVLVSTTVIEVGVDVPNAGIMIIEQAERFGLSQLHQLRGRVGRGGEQSYCILITDKVTEVARERIRTMVESNDGFYIAEMDMKLRGPGEFFGTKQSGLPSLRIANILRDFDILELARREAISFVAKPSTPDALKSAISYIQGHWQRRYGLVQVG